VTTTRDDRMALFTKLQDPANQPEFWARVADNVDWTVKGTHPLAGRYHSKSEFMESTFARLGGVLPGGVKLQIKHLDGDRDTAIAELHSMSMTKEGAQFANDYCWASRFQDDVIVDVPAYLDSMMVAYTILRNESTSPEDAPSRTDTPDIDFLPRGCASLVIGITAQRRPRGLLHIESREFFQREGGDP